jgi:phosphatidylserine decarboxylase
MHRKRWTEAAPATDGRGKLGGHALGFRVKQRAKLRPVVLAAQLMCMSALIGAVALQIWYFPNPSPVVSWLLPPELRWPTALIKDWIESDTPDRSFVAYFNRDPDRNIPPGNNFVSPADGVLKGIFPAGRIDHFTIGLSFWDVHVVRSPMAGTITAVEQQGAVLFKNSSETANMAYLEDKAGPVQQIITLENEYGEFKLRLITSYWASRLKVWAMVGQKVEKGERVGKILLGSSVVFDLPAGFDLQPAPGERLVAGETIILDLDGSP